MKLQVTVLKATKPSSLLVADAGCMFAHSVYQRIGGMPHRGGGWSLPDTSDSRSLLLALFGVTDAEIDEKRIPETDRILLPITSNLLTYEKGQLSLRGYLIASRGYGPDTVRLGDGIEKESGGEFRIVGGSDLGPRLDIAGEVPVVSLLLRRPFASSLRLLPAAPKNPNGFRLRQSWIARDGAVYGDGTRILLADRSNPETSGAERDAHVALAALAPALARALRSVLSPEAGAGRGERGSETPADVLRKAEAILCR